MESVAGADAVAGGAAETGAGGVVSRPRLFRRLGTAQVTVVSAPAASGKTVLLRSWISTAGLEQRTAWVPAGRGEREPQRFWLSVLAALRRTGPGALLVRVLTAAPHLDGWALVERLLKDLAPLDERVWLVIDDVHELGPEVLQQLELLLLRAPDELRFVLAARPEVRLGLHRLRLEGQLAEIRRSVRSRRSSGKVPQPLPVIPRRSPNSCCRSRRWTTRRCACLSALTRSPTPLRLQTLALRPTPRGANSASPPTTTM